ncbi:MAG TPA: DnaA N-terminal domain-containing protein [Bryobacteraceae bacterium]|jgi:hypothetical protein|nr:DnaA N-terminal domain-containing protein [Bryobacteraceae bacterium]
MSAAPAYSSQQVHIPGGWFHCPNAIVDNVAKLTPAEAFLALVAFQNGKNGEAAPVDDEIWVRKTGMTAQSRRNAEKGLIQHRLLDKSGRRYDVRGFIGWARHANPSEKRTVGRGPSKPVAPPKLHPECESGCALTENRASLVSIGSEEKTKPVLPSVQDDVQRGAATAETPVIGAAPSGPVVDSADSPTPHVEPEVKWAKTLAAMRSGFTTAGVDLLMRLLTLLWSLADFKGVSDYVLASAVTRSYAENRRRMESPVLLLKLVPAVLATWRAEGKRLDTSGPEDSPGIARGAAYPVEPEDSPNPSAWMLIRRLLKSRIPEQDYRNWVARAEFGRFDAGGDLLVWLPDAVSVEWFEQEYRGLVSEIARQIDVGVKRVIFRMPREEDLAS